MRRWECDFCGELPRRHYRSQAQEPEAGFRTVLGGSLYDAEMHFCSDLCELLDRFATPGGRNGEGYTKLPPLVKILDEKAANERIEKARAHHAERRRLENIVLSVVVLAGIRKKTEVHRFPETVGV